jgi:hypothetical protein
MLVSYLVNRLIILFFRMTFLSLQRLYKFILRLDVIFFPSFLRSANKGAPFAEPHAMEA